MTRILRSLAAATALAAAAAIIAPAAAQAPAAPAGAATGQQSFLVIVNSANPVQSLNREQLSKLFLKKTPRWPSGREVMPVDLAGRTAVRTLFSERVHQKSVISINSYWRQQIYAGRDVPPPAMRSEKDVVEFVRSTPDAIGYVSANAELGRSIKIVAVQN